MVDQFAGSALTQEQCPVQLIAQWYRCWVYPAIQMPKVTVAIAHSSAMPARRTDDRFIRLSAPSTSTVATEVPPVRLGSVRMGEIVPSNDRFAPAPPTFIYQVFQPHETFAQFRRGV